MTFLHRFLFYLNLFSYSGGMFSLVTTRCLFPWLPHGVRFLGYHTVFVSLVTTRCSFPWLPHGVRFLGYHTVFVSLVTARCLLSLVVFVPALVACFYGYRPGFLDYARVAIVTGVVSFQHFSGDDPQMWQPSQGVSKGLFTAKDREGEIEKCTGPHT